MGHVPSIRASNMIAALTTTLLAVPVTKPPLFPFPQDCSHFNGTSHVPTWYDECAKTAGGCFSVIIPKEKEYNVGNTTFGSSKSGGTNWCIDHLQGYIYNKV